MKKNKNANVQKKCELLHFKNHCPQKTTNTFTPPPPPKKNAPPKNGHFGGGGVNFFSERGLILS